MLAKTVLDAQKDISILQKDLEDFSELVSQDERNLIIEKLSNLENLIENKSDREAIKKAIEALEKTSENFILQKVNSIMVKNLSGKKV